MPPACRAAGNATANPLASCPTSTDPQGSGKLRLTSAAATQEGGVFASTSVPTSQGLDVTFNSYQYGGTGADGIAFMLAAVDPANPVTPATLGQSGGSLGYSAKNSTTPGLTDGYLGVGIDAYGNFSNKYEGTGCTDPANIARPDGRRSRGARPRQWHRRVLRAAEQRGDGDVTEADPAGHHPGRVAGAGRGGVQPEFVVGDDTVRAGGAGRRLRRHFHPGGRARPGAWSARCRWCRPGFTRRAGSTRTGSPSSWRSAGRRPPARRPTSTRSITWW